MTWTEDGQVIAYVTYQYNNSYITTVAPVETWHSGKHILTLYYPIDHVAASVASHFYVYLRLAGGTGTVDVGGCIASIAGQSMGGTYAWDGMIEIGEEVGRVSLMTEFKNRGYTDALSYEKYGEKNWGLSQTVKGKFLFGGFCMPVEEDAT